MSFNMVMDGGVHGPPADLKQPFPQLLGVTITGSPSPQSPLSQAVAFRGGEPSCPRPALPWGSSYGTPSFWGVKKPPYPNVGRLCNAILTAEGGLAETFMAASPSNGPIWLPSLLLRGLMLRAVLSKLPARRSPSQSQLPGDPTCDTRPGQPLVETVAHDVGRLL